MGLAWRGIAFVPPLLPLPYDEIDHLPGLMMMDLVDRGVVVMVMYDSYDGSGREWRGMMPLAAPICRRVMVMGQLGRGWRSRQLVDMVMNVLSCLLHFRVSYK